MKRPVIFISFILFATFFIGADTQKQKPQNGDEQVRSYSLNRTPQFHSRKIPSVSQPLPSEWARFYDEDGQAEIFSLLPTADGGCVITGWTWPAEDPHDWLLKLSSDGEVEFKFEDLCNSELNSVEPTSDGGFIAVGRVNVGQPNWPIVKIAVVKLSSQFEIEWGHYYSKPTHQESARFASQTADGGYIVAGNMQMEDYNIDPMDLGVLKLSSTGDIEWQYAYGGDQAEWVNFWYTTLIIQTSDGGYILGSGTLSFGAGGIDLWLLKLTATGAIEWQHTYGGVRDEFFMEGGPHIQPTSDGGCIVAGTTASFGAGSSDVWVFKLFSDGEIDWQYTYGGESSDSINSIRPTNDGKYILAGYTASFGLEQGTGDGWLLKISDSGLVEWQKSYGGEEQDYFVEAQQTIDGGYIAAGGTYSFSAAGTPYPGSGGDRYADVFVVKVGSDGDLGPGDGLIKVSNTNAVPSVTSAVPSDTNVSPQDPGAVLMNLTPSFEVGSVSSYLVASNSIQPPIITGFKSEPDRGLTKGIRVDEITGEMHPWNIQHNFDDDIERVIAFWKYADEGYTSYREIPDVVLPIDIFEFQNEILNPLEFTKARHYAFATETSQGVSPKSPPVGGGIETSQNSKSRVSSSSKNITQKDAAVPVQPKSSQDILVKSESPSRSDKQFQTGIQPPVNITVTRGENSQIIRWEQNPLNNPESVSGYQVYRVWGEGDDNYYEFIGRVPNTEYEFVDEVPDIYEEFVYAVSAVDVDYKESSKKPVRK